MSALIKVFVTIAVISVILSVIGLAIPQTLTTNINNAIIYFLEQTSALGNLFDVSTFFTCVSLLANYFIDLGLITGLWWIGHAFID